MKTSPYLEEVRKIKLLKYEELTELFKTIEFLKKKRRKTRSKSKKKEYELKIAEIINQIINANLRFVLSVASNIQREKAVKMELEDMISAGNLGLYKAVKGFKLKKNFRFSTYAYYCIRRSIIEAIKRDGCMVRIPDSARKRFAMVYEFKKKYFEKYKLKPTDEEIADYLKIPLKNFLSLSDVIRKAPVSIENFIKEGEKENQRGKIKIGELLKSDEDFGPEKEYEETEKKEIVRIILSFLTDREEIILRRYLGINEEQMIFRQIGEELGITKQRVQQLYKEALGKLRTSKRVERLNPF